MKQREPLWIAWKMAKTRERLEIGLPLVFIGFALGFYTAGQLV